MLAALTPPRERGRRKRRTVAPDQRKRVKLACDECRRCRAKCNGQTPCERCSATQRSCKYMETPSERQHDSRIDREERLSLLEEMFAALYPDTALDLESLRALRDRIITSRQNEEGTNLVLSDVPPPTASVTVVNQGQTHFDGRSSYWSFFSSVRQAVTDNLVGVDDNDEADCDGSIHQPSSISFGTDWKTAVLAALPPKGVVDFLAATFFRFAQGSRCYIHPEIFSRKLAAFYNGSHEFEMRDPLSSRRSAEFISVLFMVFAIGSQFAEVGSSDATAQDQPETFTDPSMLDFSRITVPKPSQNPGWRFYEVSRKLLPDIICSSSMTSIQVCILQGIFLPSTKSRDAGYNMLGLALRMAINMGMHRSFSATSLHPHVRELRNRLWWSVYVAERLFSIEMGRPLSISDSEIDAPFPVFVPEWSSSAKPMNVDGLIAMTKLCQLMGKIVEAVYCKPADGKGLIIQPKVYQQLKRELEQYKRELPEEMKFGDCPSRSVAHLALTYEQATMLLTRSCLNFTASSQSSPVAEEAKRFLHQQAQDCKGSAIASIKILQSLQSRSLLCQYSFHDSLYCIAALYVLLLVGKSNGLTHTSRETISHGVMILLNLASGSEAASSGLRYIIRAMQSYCTDRYHGSIGNMSEDTISSEQSRKAWKAWMNDPTLADRPGSVDDHFNAPKGLLQPLAQDGSLNDSNIHHTDQFLEESPGWSAMSDLEPFWIPDHPGFDILGRDLAGEPYLSPLNELSFI
ncbi:fungal-specific transcription factor domain-containing protein [Aspergillus karnatakaensis]|uniref:transcription factor domain-containing protein n=1 Tax=Aspergillus karnatakaensis TaxID=1810916 RepID=UPI003CCD1F27